MFRFGGIAMWFLLAGANAKDKNTDEVIMLQTSILLPSMGEQAAIATEEKHDVQQVDVDSVKASSETTSLAKKTPRVSTPLSEAKRELKKMEKKFTKLKLEEKELEKVKKMAASRLSKAEKDFSSASNRLEKDEQDEKTSLDASINAENCLKLCVCKQTHSDDECNFITCDLKSAFDVASQGSGRKGSGKGGDGTSDGGAEGDGSSDGGSEGDAEGDDTSADGSGDADSSPGGSGGASTPGPESSDSPDSDSSDSFDADGFNAGDSAANTAQSETGDDEGEQAVATGNSGNSDNSGGGDEYSDEEALSDEEKSLSFRPVLCFAMIAPLFQLM